MIGKSIVFQQTWVEQLNMCEKEERKGDLKGKERGEKEEIRKEGMGGRNSLEIYCLKCDVNESQIKYLTKIDHSISKL